MLPIQPLRFLGANEELGSVGVRTTIGHRNNAGNHMFQLKNSWKIALKIQEAVLKYQFIMNLIVDNHVTKFGSLNVFFFFAKNLP